MPTNLNSVSLPINNTRTQIYQVPTGATAIALLVTISPVVAQAIQIFLSRQKTDNTFITLIPGKQIPANYQDVYSPQLNKLILLSGEKLFAQALTVKTVRAVGLFGLPCYFDPLQSVPNQVAHISISIAERS
jgi:hypothetical protein